MLFRDEEHVERWCEREGLERGAVLDAETCWRLAQAWWGDRLDPEWRPRSLAESQALLESAGLRGAFWELAT